MEQYQLDLETIKDFLQESNSNLLDEYNVHEIITGYKSCDNCHGEGAIKNDQVTSGASICPRCLGNRMIEDSHIYNLPLDSREFCIELAKLIYGEDMICVKCGAKEAGVHMEGCIFYDGIMKYIKYWAYKLKEWVFLTNEALAHEAAEAVRQVKNNTLDK